MALKDLVAKAERPEEQSRQAAPEPSVRTHPTVAPATCIDASTEFSGKLRCAETIRIDGRVKGEVHCEKAVIVGEAASIQAVIQADSVVIAGEVEGDIAARRKITLQKSARVIGDLCTPGIVIEEGAKLEGRIVIGSDDRPAAPKQRPAAQPRESAPSRPPAPPQEVTPPGP